MTYQPSRVPPRRLYHEDWRRGFIQNSPHGNEIAHARGCDWVDNDFQLSLRAEAIANAHGWPERVWGTTRFVLRPWVALSKLRHVDAGRVYSLRTLADAFKDAAKLGQSVEAEVKDWRPYTSPIELKAIMSRIARHAQAAYGPKWAERVNIKFVSTMAGGLTYSLAICRAAHGEGIPTLLTVRGKDRFNRFKDHQEITYVRNSLVIRKVK